MLESPESAPEAGGASPSLDPRLVQWLAIQALQDRYARLVEGGADSDARIELASLFVDLPASVPRRFDEDSDDDCWVMHELLEDAGQREPSDADPCLDPGVSDAGRNDMRWLLIGGPGSGKSTVTTMVAQVFRLPWIDRQIALLPDRVRDAWQRTREGLLRIIERETWVAREDLLPLRINLPALARWMAPRDADPASVVWDYLASQIVSDLAGEGLSVDLSASEVRAMIEAIEATVWILDGLDEVPRSAGRERVLAAVRTLVGRHPGRVTGMLVATRPQGYEGEFDELDALLLHPLPPEVAREYGERLIRAWWSRGSPSDLSERIRAMHQTFSQPEIQALLQTPLHTTMAALLFAARGTLPSAKSLLFDHYFSTTLQRELGKPFDHGIRQEDEPILRALHARAGLVLQARSQAQAGARSSLRRRELRELLAALYVENGFREDDVRANAERMMRFASERLVLLLHSAEGTYEFSVRSLQEFFAAEALVEGEPAVVRRRLDVIALNPHWYNVLTFIVSRCALEQSKTGRERALLFTASLCRSLNTGEVGGVPSARLFTGSRLALAMLRETERYGNPWLHDPLWDVAFEIANAPMQSVPATGVAFEVLVSGPLTLWNDRAEIHARLGLNVAAWPSSGAHEYQRRLLEAAEVSLSQANGQPLIGFHLLAGLLLAAAPAARDLAEKHAPRTPDGAREMVAAIRRWSPIYRDGTWLWEFIALHPESFPPGWAASFLRLGSPGVPAVGRILQKTFSALSEVPSIEIQWYEGAVRVLVKRIGQGNQVWEQIAGEMPAVGPEWMAWKRLAELLAAPSEEALAKVLDAAADPAARSDLLLQRHRLPWPVLACLELTLGSDDMKALAARIREGHFGTVEDWRAAEARWATSPRVTRSDIATWLSEDGPWNPDIASKGLVLSQIATDTGWSHNDATQSLIEWIGSHPSRHTRMLVLLGHFLNYLNGVPLHIARAADGEQIMSFPSYYDISYVLPDLYGPDAEGWFELLDRRGRASRNRLWQHSYFALERVEAITAITHGLLARLRARPDQWGLIDALTCVLTRLPDTDLSALELPPIPDDAPARIHATRAALAILAGRFEPSELPTLLGRLCGEQDGARYDDRTTLASILGERTRDSAGATSLLLAALDATPPPEPDVRDALLGALFKQLRRAAPQAFVTPEAWREHDLPAPYFAAQPPPQPPPRIVRIAELRDIRLFKETPPIDIPFPQPTEERGQWIVLVGENGVGKTTLLRALALAMASPSVGTKLLDERLPFARNGGEGVISVELSAGLLSTAVRRDERERTERVEALSPSDAARPWVVGYGVRRGNARGEKDREPEIGPIGELHTLFDRPASLINAVEWLKDLDRQVLREQRQRSSDAPLGPRQGVWMSVVNALKKLLGITDIEVDDLHVYVKHPAFDRVRLDALSDGYLTTTGWMIDLIARWIDRQRELDEPVGADVLRQMCGFVLIDEIDLHLHPRWQMRIIDDVRSLFPRLSFVVTTHNPLTLQGARRGEVYVMRNDGGRIELVQRDIRPGHDVDRVLFDQFGVEHTFDRDTRDLLARHREMVERGVPPDDPDRLNVEARLVERFGSVGDTLRTERKDTRGALPRLRPEDRSLLAPFLKKRD